jgi:nucleotide-binding universal stress UspA family protein
MFYIRRMILMNAAPDHSLHILLGVDGSLHSMAAVHLLQDLPLAQAACGACTITVLAILHLKHPMRRHVLEAVLEHTKTQLSQPGVEVHTGLLHGDPAAELVNYADEHQPDLIVLGALGMRATLGILMGGVAQQVVEYAHSPVLIVRAPYDGLRRVLLVTDGSPSSEKACGYLCGLSQMPCLPLPPATELHLAHVMPPLLQKELYMRTWPMGPDALPYFPEQEIDEVSRLQAEDEERYGRELLNKTRNSIECGIQGAPERKIVTGLLRGDAATEIIEYTKAEEIDLIIAGSRGLSQVRSWLLGSVSRKLLHYAGCSVLVVK